MTEQSTKPESKKEMMKSTSLYSHHFRLTMMVALITVGTVAAIGYAGWWLDSVLGFDYLFLIIGVVVSFPISQIALYRWIKAKYVPFIKSQEKKNHG